jgi:hypothetical protein
MLLSNRAMIGSNPEVLFAFTNSVTTEWALRNNRDNWNKTGRLRNFPCGDAKVPRVSAAATAALGGDIALYVFTDTTHGTGSFAVGQLLTGVDVVEGTRIVAWGTGTGANSGGTYTVNISQTVTAQTITGKNVSLTEQASQPAGNTHPVAYVLAQKPGRISSHKICYTSLDGTAAAKIGSLVFTKTCVVGVDGSATGTLIIGSLIDGTVAIVIDASAVGKMALGAEGLATITVEANGAILGHVAAAGLAPIIIGAIADIAGTGWLAGNAPIELDGTLQSYAIGWLEGSTTDKSTLTAANIAVAVWNSLAAAYTDPGTMGKYLGDLGAGANPWDSVIDGGNTAKDVLRFLLAFASGAATGAGTDEISFMSPNGTKTRIRMEVDSNGNRTLVTLDGDDE